MTRKIMLIVALVLVSLGVGLAAASTSASPSQSKANKTIAFAKSNLFVEINATAGDAGLQLDLDGEAWERLTIDSPDGHTILDVTSRGRLEGFGLTGLTFESSEPSFDVHPLAKFKARFPEGTYRFRGETVDGRTLVGKNEFTHDFPAGPVVTAPAENAVLPRDNAAVTWKRVTEPAGIKIIAYQVIVTQVDPERELIVDLPATATSMTVPSDFLMRKTEYKVEVIAREKSGNQTITEIPFTTA